MSEIRQCTLCGRAGIRGFTVMGGGRVICTANRACGARRGSSIRALERVRDRIRKQAAVAGEAVAPDKGTGTC